jgi:hypothetical protein
MASSRRSRWLFLGAFADSLSRARDGRDGATAADLRAVGGIRLEPQSYAVCPKSDRCVSQSADQKTPPIHNAPTAAPRAAHDRPTSPYKTVQQGAPQQLTLDTAWALCLDTARVQRGPPQSPAAGDLEEERMPVQAEGIGCEEMVAGVAGALTRASLPTLSSERGARSGCADHHSVRRRGLSIDRCAGERAALPAASGRRAGVQEQKRPAFRPRGRACIPTVN